MSLEITDFQEVSRRSPRVATSVLVTSVSRMVSAWLQGWGNSRNTQTLKLNWQAARYKDARALTSLMKTDGSLKGQ